MLTSFFVANPRTTTSSLQSLSRWHKRPNSSTNAAHGEKALCRRRSRPSPTAAQLDDQREESINFYGGLVQRSHREANFSPQERSQPAGTPLNVVCSAPSSLDAIGKAGLLADIGATSPFLELAEEETDTSWMNTTTTMLESNSPSTLNDWLKLDNMFTEEGDICVGPLYATKVSGSSASTGERFPSDARKTASADVCRIELDESPRRRFGCAETSVTVHGVCYKTINAVGSGGGGDGGGGDGEENGSGSDGGSGGSDGKFSNGKLPSSAAVTSSTTSVTGYNISGTVAAGTSETLGATTAQHQQRTLRNQCEDSSIRLSSNSSITEGRNQLKTDGSTAVSSSFTADDGLRDEITPSMTPLFLPEVDWTNATCIGGGLDVSRSIVVSEQQRLQEQQQLWINSPASSSSNITDSELERQLDEYDYTATRDRQQHHLISIPQYEQHQVDNGPVSSMESSVDCSQLLAGHAGDNASMSVSLHESTPVSALVPFIALQGDEHPLQQGAASESYSLNILKWLQEDISSTIIMDKQQPITQELAGVTYEPTASNFLATDTLNPSYSVIGTTGTSLSSATNYLQLPLLGAPFENSLNHIPPVNRSPTPVAGGGHKTAIKRKSARGGAPLALHSPVAKANASSVDPPCDHNYFTMKRRIQETDEAHCVKHKLSKLSHALEEQSRETSVCSAKDTTITRSSNTDRSWCADDGSLAVINSLRNAMAFASNISKTCARQSTTNAILPSCSTPTTAATNSNRLDKIPSVAHRKAPTLKVQVGGDLDALAIQAVTTTAHLGSGQNPIVPLNKTLTTPMITTATTTTTTTTTSSNNFTNHNFAQTLNTPDLTNDILDLEDEKFDLLSFIDNNDDSLDLNKYNSVVDAKPTLGDVLPSTSLLEEQAEGQDDDEHQELPGEANREPKCSSSKSNSCTVKNSPENKIYQLLTLDSEKCLARSATSSSSVILQCHPTINNSNCSIGSRSSASSVCGDSDASSGTTVQTPKRRGRPPKAVGTVRDRSEYEHLSEADWRYREQRDKNNEASRKSRINRKDRELKLETEADRLSLQHQKLSYEERRLQRDCQKWRKGVMKLALL